jgi:predicted TIM-barrel fold metal-dependent hydrolase
MQGKIALEEHFATEEFLQDVKRFFIREGVEVWERAKRIMTDITGERLELMDEAGIEKSIISLSSPTIQGILNTDDAIDAARRINDYTAEKIANYRHRFEAFAALPTQSPEAAIIELQRCVKDYGFKGALINGFCQIENPDIPVFLDEPQYFPFWEEVEKLNVPVYLHPRPMPEPVRKLMYGDNHFWMETAAWGWHADLGTQVLRLISSGIFDRCPNLQIVIGHMGELIPIFLWRITNRSKYHKRDNLAELPINEYFLRNISITTSGNLSTPALMCAMMEMSTDRIMFSTDYPYESMKEAADWFDNIPFSDIDKEKMGRLNAAKLFNIEL